MVGILVDIIRKNISKFLHDSGSLRRFVKIIFFTQWWMKYKSVREFFFCDNEYGHNQRTCLQCKTSYTFWKVCYPFQKTNFHGFSGCTTV